MRFFTHIPDLSMLTTMDKRYAAIRLKYFRKAMESSVNAVQGAATGEIPVVSGSVQKSIISEVHGGAGSVVGVVTSSAREPNVGPFVLNFGRKSKQMPPVEALKGWIRQRGLGQNGQSIEQTAFLIARSIANKGTKAVHFMVHGLGKATGVINSSFEIAVDNIVEELGK